MQAWEKDVKMNTMLNHGKRQIIILGNFIVHKDILKNVKVRESNDRTDFILSHIWSDWGVKKN